MTREIEDIAEGVRLWQLSYIRDEYKQRILVLEIDTASPAVSLRAALGRSLWDGDPLETIRERESAVAAWQALDQPSQGSDLGWPGLAVVDGRLIAAPGDGPVLTITPEGFVDLHDSSSHGSNLSTLQSKTQSPLSIDWVNRTPTTHSLGLVFDPGLLRSSFLSSIRPLAVSRMEFFSKDTLVTLSERGDTAVSLPPWTANPNATFEWKAEPSYIPEDHSLFTPGWSGVVGAFEGANHIQETLNAKVSGTLRIETTPDWTRFATVVPLRNWLLRNRRIVVPSQLAKEDPRAIPMARSAAGINRLDHRLWLAIVLDRDRYALGMTEYQLAELMVALGATDAAQAAVDLGVATAVRDRSILPPERIPRHGRLALLVNERQPPRSDPWVDLSILTQIIASGTRPLDWENAPSKAVDRRQGDLPSLDHFYAAIPEGETPVTLVLDFQKEYLVSQVDIVHAESAGFSPNLNAREVRIASRPKGEERWIPVLTAVNDPPRSRQPIPFPSPVPARQLQFTFTEPNAIPGSDVVRIVEIVVWGRPR